jgi:hypothetical protein
LNIPLKSILFPQQGDDHVSGELSEALGIFGQSERQHGLEPFGTGKIRGQPDGFQGDQYRLVEINRRFASFPGFGLGESFEASEYPDGVFSVTLMSDAKFVEDGGLLGTRGLFIPQIDRFEILAFGSGTHNFPP